MKEIKLISQNGEYFLQASKYFVAEPDAIRGCYIEKGFIIAKDYNDAQALLMRVINNEFDNIVLAPGQDKDYKISYWDKDNKETHICLGAMNEMDAEDRFNGEFPGNIFISAKEIQI